MAMMTQMVVITPKGDSVNASPELDSANPHVINFDMGGYNQLGRYTVKWSVAARDGHPSSGSFSFTIESPAPSADSAAPVATLPASTIPPAVTAPQPRDSATTSMNGDNSVGMIVVRWLAFLSTFLIVGAVVFRFRLLGDRAFSDSNTFIEVSATNAATLGLFASVGMLLALIVKAAHESAAMPGVSTTTVLFASSWGWCICCAVIASFAAIIAFANVCRNSGAGSLQSWRIAMIASVVLVVTPALTGHAIGNDRAWLTVPNDIIHVAVGSVWLGTLATIVLVGMSGALKSPDAIPARVRIAQLIKIFSPMALTCGALVVATGTVASLIHLPRVNALWTTPYGSALYRKLIFVLLLFAVGAWNWRRTKPRLNADDSGLVSLKRAATIEIVLAAIVLLLTAILVALAIPD